MTFIPSEDSTERMRQIKKVRSQAFNISKKASENMQRHVLAKFSPSEYSIGDEIYVKFIGKDKRVYRGGSSIAAPRELNDIITESRVMTTSYKEAMHDKMIGLQQNAAKEDLNIDRDIPSDGHIAEFHYLSLVPDQAQYIGEQVNCADHNILYEVCGTLNCNTCNCLNNTNEILCHRCGIIHTENQCLFNSSEDIKQTDLNKDHDHKFDVDLDSNTTLDSMLEENFDPVDDNEISVGMPHKGPNDSTDTLHENDILLSNDQNFELIIKWLQHKLLEFEDQSFGKGILLSKDERSMVFYHFLKLHGFVLPFKQEIDGEFILVNHPFMDLYDDFRSYLALIFSVFLSRKYVT
ncbi:unnamed protein product [Mytilus coruscus]|uniref:Uncharacterized protein n=1 Tax=Mytilus coruscus TaxID=42192 RepID=A0A6J8D6P0_MYTCO|nr:unnamed protein product [Mytilus coruscus]